MMKNKIKNILFDFGGVIVSLDKQQALNRFKEIGFADIDNYLGEFRQSGIFLDYETGALGVDQFVKEFRRLAGKENISKEEIDSAWLAFLAGIPAYKYDLMKELRKKYTVYMLSNTNPSVMGWARSSAFSPTGEPVTAFFDQCFLSYELKCAKPDLEIFEKIIEQSGMKPEETLFFDDGEANIEASKKFGFQTYLTNQDEDLRKVFVDRELL